MRKGQQAIKDGVFVSLPSVCVDEFQNLKNPADSLCESLHGSNLNLKIVPVYFGLGNAPDVLDEAGVSRTSEETNIPLNALSMDDGEIVLQEFLNFLDVEYSADVDRDAIAINSRRDVMHDPII